MPCVLGYPIYSDPQPTLTPTFGGGSWQASLPLTNLTDRRLSRVARSTDATLASTQFDIDLKTQRQVRIAALLGHNISLAGLVRARAMTSFPLADYERVGDAAWTAVNTPTRTANEFTCADGVTLDRIGDNNAAAAEYFYVQPGTLVNGINEVRFRIAKVSAYAAHQVNIWDATSSAYRLNLKIDFTGATPVVTVIAGAGSVASVTARGDGSFDVVAYTTNGTVAGHANQITALPTDPAVAADQAEIRIGSFMVWASAGSTDQLVYDSGYVTAWPAVFPAASIPSYHPSSGTLKLTAEDAVGFPMPILFVPSAPQNAQFWRWNIQDTGNAAGYVQVGRLVLAYGYSPTVNLAYGVKLGWESDSSRTTTDGGEAFYADRPRRRTATFTLDSLPEDETMVSPYDLMRRLGTTGQLFFVFDDTDTALLYRRSFLCVQKDISPIAMPMYRRFGVPINLVEEL